MDYFMSLSPFMAQQLWYYLTHNKKKKWDLTFPNGIQPKLNVNAQLEFGLAYYDVGVQHVSHYARGTAPAY